MHNSSFYQPIILQGDLFTSLHRTPWAGTKISQTIKADIVVGKIQTIGESWEVSTDPEMPSLVKNSTVTLADLIAKNPREMLSDFLLKKNHTDCQILVKIINAATPLSLQVHPRDDDSHLKLSECGKPESWLILEAEPDAGVYFGFSRARSKTELKKLLLEGKFTSSELQFIPVKKFDYFDIPEGIPHVISAGVVVLEPQRILPHKSGKTYRMWDWNRKYDKDGQLDLQNGKERALHIEESLELIDPERQVGPQFGESLKKIAVESKIRQCSIASYPKNAHLQTHLLMVNGQLNVLQKQGYGCLTCLQGSVLFGNGERLSKGESAFVPYASLPLRLESELVAQCVYVQPALVDVQFS